MTDTSEVNVSTTAEEFQTISEAGDKQLDAVNYLLEQEREKVREEQHARRYIRARLATRLIHGGYGSRYAKLVGEMEQSLGADMVALADLQSASFDTPKLWTRDGSKTKTLMDHTTDCQNTSVTQISCRTNSLTEIPWHSK